MELHDNIFGCFFKVGFDPNPNLSEQYFLNIAEEFRAYMSGDRGIFDKLKKLKNGNYGEDLKLALFEFHVKPTLAELQKIKEIQPYRQNEKSIGIPIIINDENFFSKSEDDRYRFLKQSILQKMELLAEVVKKKKLDTNMERLKIDLKKVLDEIG